MRYAIMTEAGQKVARLEPAIRKAADKYYSDCHNDFDARNLVDEMRRRKCIKDAPPAMLDDLKQRLNAFYTALGKEKAVWNFDGKERLAEWEDFPVVSGYDASLVLRPKRFWDFAGVGFQNFWDFVGTVGAIYENYSDHKMGVFPGYRWRSESGDRTFETIVSADSNGDFRLIRTDITPLETLDPAGNSVSYRPVDESFISGYHSVEPAFLVSLMRYAEQEKIPTVLDDDKADEFMEEISGMAQRTGLFGDFGTGGMSAVLLVNMAWPIPPVGQRTVHNIYTQSGCPYGIYVDDSRNLVIKYEDKEQDGRYSMVFQPSDADHLIRGLFEQAIKGLGRTSAAQLIDIVRKRKSPEVERYIDEVRGRQ
jgi:hypothetical protein